MRPRLLKSRLHSTQNILTRVFGEMVQVVIHNASNVSPDDDGIDALGDAIRSLADIHDARRELALALEDLDAPAVSGEARPS